MVSEASTDAVAPGADAALESRGAAIVVARVAPPTATVFRKCRRPILPQSGHRIVSSFGSLISSFISLLFSEIKRSADVGVRDSGFGVGNLRLGIRRLGSGQGTGDSGFRTRFRQLAVYCKLSPYHLLLLITEN